MATEIQSRWSAINCSQSFVWADKDSELHVSYSEIVQPFRNKAEQKDLTDLSTNVMQLLEVREECASVTTALEAQKEVVVWK